MLRSFLFFMLMIFSGVHPAFSQSGEEEYNLKAAFVYNFIKYINWGPFSSENDFLIGVVGPSLINQPLEEIAKTKTANYRKIVILHFDKPEDIGFCNILYIPKNPAIPLSAVMGKVNRGTLTISEEEGDARQGTAFNFVLIKDKLRFESNVKAISSAGLKVSSQLLKLAIIVD